MNGKRGFIMVLESLISAENAENHTLRVFLLGILYASVAVVFELFVFHGKIAGLFVSITVFASIPLMHKIIKLEGKRSLTRKMGKKNFLIRHSKALKAFVFLFLGFLVAFSFWFIVLPTSTAETVFSSQIDEITNVQNKISGHAVQPGSFPVLFFHNFKVLLFCFVFSFFFGAGAIFILTWNASIIAIAIGSFVRNELALGTTNFIFPAFILGTFSYAFFGYIFHGIFEIISYFLAGLAGGIISVAVIRHDLFHKRFQLILKDSLWLIGLSIAFLVVAGLIEVFVFPLIF